MSTETMQALTAGAQKESSKLVRFPVICS